MRFAYYQSRDGTLGHIAIRCQISLVRCDAGLTPLGKSKSGDEGVAHSGAFVRDMRSHSLRCTNTSSNTRPVEG